VSDELAQTSLPLGFDIESKKIELKKSSLKRERAGERPALCIAANVEPKPAPASVSNSPRF
jgi:hypothetical protein